MAGVTSAGRYRPWRRRRPLSAREREVLRLLAAGQRTREIASALSISPRTVEDHIRNMRTALNARTTEHLVYLATAQGIIEADLRHPLAPVA